MMLLAGLDSRLATSIRLAGLALICWSVARAHPAPGTGGRGLVVSICLVLCAACWLVWLIGREGRRGVVTGELYLMAASGGMLLGAAPDSAASVFVFVAAVTAAVRVELARALLVPVLGALAAGLGALVYHDSALGWVAYTLGFVVAALAASNRRDVRERAEQAELLLAQTQRSHEEELRAARLEESTRIAREIHDLLAHALAGLTIQLEATASLIERGAEPASVLARVRRAHELAREGLIETRRAVGALRGEGVSVPAGLQTLLADYRSGVEAPAQLTIEGDLARLDAATGETVLRVVREALTNVRKHAPGADVSVRVRAGGEADDEVVVVVEDRVPAGTEAPAPDGLAGSGGGYGLRGMSERAQILGGTVSAGATARGWRVELRLPSPARRTDLAGREPYA